MSCGGALAAALAIAALAAPGGAGAPARAPAATPPGDSTGTASEAVGTAIGEKGSGPVSPDLAAVAEAALAGRSPARQAALAGLPASGPGSPLTLGGEPVVRVRFGSGAIARLPALRRAGGSVLAASRELQSVTAAVAPDDVEALAAVAGVAYLSLEREPFLRAPGPCQGGSVISEGVGQLGVEPLRAPGLGELEGAGVTVGVLSDSFDRASTAVGGGTLAADAEADVGSRDLPGKSGCPGQAGPVDVRSEFLGSFATFDEGRAMAQIVHDLAPRAAIEFASAFNGEAAFAGEIEAMAADGVDVIVDDVFYLEEPFFQEGPVAAAASAAAESGSVYVSAAGNDHVTDAEGNEIASWEAPAFRDAGGCPPAVAALSGFNSSHCMDFDPGSRVDRTFGIRVAAGERLNLDLQWAEPWGGVSTDFDAFLLDSQGSLLTGSSDENGLSQRPVEIVQWENETGAAQVVQLVVNRFEGASPRVKFAIVQGRGAVTGTEYPRSGGGDVVGPSVYGHAAARGAIAVAAVPYSNAATVEPYSSRGPATHYFGPVVADDPAAELLTPEVVAKPDVAATDCVRTTFFATLVAGSWRFCGTSAAAPHAAGVAALIAEAEPSVTPAEVRAALAGTGSAVGSFGPCARGGGLIDAVDAVAAAAGPAPDWTRCTAPPDATGPVFLAPGFWGSETPEPAPSAATALAVPSTAPRTRIAKRPPRVLRAARLPVRVVFRFAADQTGVRYRCKVDRGTFRACPNPFARRFGAGRHVVRVRAVSSAGEVDQTPAVIRFRIVRRV